MASPQSAQLERSQPMSTSCGRQLRVLGRRCALAAQATRGDDALRALPTLVARGRTGSAPAGARAARLQGYDVRVYALQLFKYARQFVAALYVPLQEADAAKQEQVSASRV